MTWDLWLVGFCSFSGGFEYEKYQIPKISDSQHEALSISIGVAGGSSPGKGSCFFPITNLSSAKFPPVDQVPQKMGEGFARELGIQSFSRLTLKRLGLWHRFQRASFLLMVFC